MLEYRPELIEREPFQINVKTESPFLGNKLDVQLKLIIEAVDENTCRQVLAGSIKVNMFGVGRIVEGIVKDSLQNTYKYVAGPAGRQTCAFYDPTGRWKWMCKNVHGPPASPPCPTWNQRLTSLALQEPAVPLLPAFFHWPLVPAFFFSSPDPPTPCIPALPTALPLLMHPQEALSTCSAFSPPHRPFFPPSNPPPALDPHPCPPTLFH